MPSGFAALGLIPKNMIQHGGDVAALTLLSVGVSPGVRAGASSTAAVPASPEMSTLESVNSNR
jgi:hypothetical protein